VEVFDFSITKTSNHINKYKQLYLCFKEKLDGPVVSALSVRSRKLSNVHKGQSSNG
jgi:hypothetical protein